MCQQIYPNNFIHTYTVFFCWPSTAFSPCWRSRSPPWPPSPSSCRTSASHSPHLSPSSLGMLFSDDFYNIFFNWNLVIFLKGTICPLFPSVWFCFQLQVNFRANWTCQSSSTKYYELSRCVAYRLHASRQRQQRVRHTPKARRRPSTKLDLIICHFGNHPLVLQI